MRPPIIRTTLLAALADMGPMTAAELADVLALKRHQVNSAITSAQAHFHVVDWRRQEPGKRGSMSPVYAHGPGKNKPMPKAISHHDRNVAYRERKRVELRVKARAAYPAEQRRGHPFSALVALARQQ